MMAMEAIKLLLNLGSPPLGKLIHYRAVDSSFREIKIKPDPDCALCGKNPTITEPISYPTSCDMNAQGLPEISTAELKEILQGDFEGILLDVREEDEHAMAHIEGCQLLPLSGWPAVAANLPKEANYLVICAAGMRSARAGTWMLSNGFTQVTNVAGGMKSWLAENPEG
jgi:adenylyltransferase/sulfurtransferase